MQKDELNWYKIAKISDAIYQEAGLKEWLGVGLMSAILAVMGGSAIWNAAQKYNVSEDQLKNALNNKEIVSKIQQVVESEPDGWNKINEMLNNITIEPQQISKPDNKYKPSKQKELTPKELSAVDYLSRTVWDESRGESLEGQKAVLSVIMNRAKKDPKNIANVVTAPSQFEGWTNKTLGKGSGKIWDNIVELSKQAVLGNFNPTIPYISFFNPKKVKPTWAYIDDAKTILVTPHLQIGNHVFLNPKSKILPKQKSIKKSPTKTFPVKSWKK